MAKETTSEPWHLGESLSKIARKSSVIATGFLKCSFALFSVQNRTHFSFIDFFSPKCVTPGYKAGPANFLLVKK